MKKLITLLALVLAACIGCAGMTGAFPAARAELPLVYPAETVISVIRLTEVQRSLAEYLYRPVLAGETKITLPEGTRYDDVGPALQSLMLDYPELFHLGRTYTITYWQNEPDVAIAVSPAYRMDARTADDLRRQLYGAALALVQADGTAVGLHDALVERVTYGGTNDMRHTAVGALLYGTATCEGYAQALSLMYRMAGIPSGVVTGSAFSSLTWQWESHAWNVMNLGGFSLIDATWNDQEGAGINTRWYFGLSTGQMAADHVPDADMDVPVCTDHAGWHIRKGRCAAAEEDVFRALQRLVTDGQEVNLRITDDALYARISGDMGAFLDAYNEWASRDSRFYGSYSYLLCDAQRCVIIRRTQ